MAVSRIKAGKAGEEAGADIAFLSASPKSVYQDHTQRYWLQIECIHGKCFPKLLGAGGLIRES